MPKIDGLCMPFNCLQVQVAAHLIHVKIDGVENPQNQDNIGWRRAIRQGVDHSYVVVACDTGCRCRQGRWTLWQKLPPLSFTLPMPPGWPTIAVRFTPSVRLRYGVCLSD